MKFFLAIFISIGLTCFLTNGFAETLTTEGLLTGKSSEELLLELDKKEATLLEALKSIQSMEAVSTEKGYTYLFFATAENIAWLSKILVIGNEMFGLFFADKRNTNARGNEVELYGRKFQLVPDYSRKYPFYEVYEHIDKAFLKTDLSEVNVKFALGFGNKRDENWVLLERREAIDAIPDLLKWEQDLKAGKVSFKGKRPIFDVYPEFSFRRLARFSGWIFGLTVVEAAFRDAKMGELRRVTLTSEDRDEILWAVSRLIDDIRTIKDELKLRKAILNTNKAN